MNLKNIFKKFVLLDLLLLIFGVSLLFFENETIISFNESVDPMSDMYGLVVLLYLIAYLFCLFFLKKKKKVGKHSFLWEIQHKDLFHMILMVWDGQIQE